MNKMPFGKYKNKLIKDIPEDYVNWMKINIFSNPKRKNLIESEMQRNRD